MYRNLLHLIKIFCGIVLLLIGIIGIFVPILQGWLFIAIAIPLIHPEYGKKMVVYLKSLKEKIKKKIE